MPDSQLNPWARKTVVDESDLFEHIFEVDSTTEDKLKVTRFCVRPGIDTLNYDPFFEYLKDNFRYFVFPENKVEEFENPLHEAQRKSSFKDNPENEGKYGELILFSLVEGILDLPMISHKIRWKQNPSDEVKGSDGLFYGEFEGYESLAIGEAKIKGQRSKAIKEALRSTDRFHGSTSDEKKRHELVIAANNLTDNLDKEQIKELSKVLTSESSTYRTIHPMFICYNSAKITNAQQSRATEEELKSELEEKLSEYNIRNYIEEKIDEKFSSIRNHWAVIMLMPVENTSEFQERIQKKIYPYS